MTPLLYKSDGPMLLCMQLFFPLQLLTDTRNKMEEVRTAAQLVPRILMIPFDLLCWPNLHDTRPRSQEPVLLFPLPLSLQKGTVHFCKTVLTEWKVKSQRSPVTQMQNAFSSWFRRGKFSLYKRIPPPANQGAQSQTETPYLLHLSITIAIGIV